MSGIRQFVPFCASLMSLSTMSSRFTVLEPVAGFPSWLRLNDVPLQGWGPRVADPSSTYRHSGRFHLSAVELMLL